MGSLETQLSENHLTATTDLSAREHRTRRRFPLAFDVRFRARYHRHSPTTGAGCTTNISSTGLWIDTATPLREGMRIEIAMSWPVLLDQTCPMKLVIYGSVVRAESHGAAVVIERYEFRTQGRSHQPQKQMAAGAQSSASV